MSRLPIAALLLLPLLAPAAANAPDGGEWQDNQRLSFGAERARAGFAPFSSEEAALAILPEKSDRQVSLDSDTAWRFNWAKDPSSRPVGFFRPGFDVSRWPTIKVPCSWQAYGANGRGGWGTPIYTNIPYPFQKDVPGGSRVMLEPPTNYTAYAARNPVGSYRRDFDLPGGWESDRIFLKFDGVDSFYYLWVNGEYVGFSKDSRSPAEFDVTRLVRPGRNTVALEVYRYSDGSYLEDQDMFRLSGIFRHTWLVRRPAKRIRDFFVKAAPARRGQFDGPWVVTCDADCDTPVETALYTFDDRLVTRSKGRMFVVEKPLLWSAEAPNCYKVVVGNGEEFVSTVFGFRLSEIRNGRYFLNGRKIKLKGSNRHETHPMFGHYVPRETHELDARELKGANCNAVRNSHYPQDDYWYYLCDTIGIYLCDEANVESHGYGYGKDSLSHCKSWEKATVARNLAMVERNKNHPSVVIWSYGNEAGPGENFAAVEKAVKARDRTRPTHYERDWSVADMEARQYPSVDWMWWKANDRGAKKPFYVSEYAHNMVNAMGNLKDYQDAIESSDVLLGATIWDWVDQGLYLDRGGKRMIGYGGDFGDRPNDGQFVMNGCVLSDRTREPGYYEIRHVFQNWSATLSENRLGVILRNKNYFVGSEGLVCRWTALGEGEVVASGIWDVSELGPQRALTNALPIIVRDLAKRGREMSLRVRFLRGEDEEAECVADDQIDFPAKGEEMLACDEDEPDLEAGDERYVFSCGRVEYAFSRKTGLLVSVATGRFSKKEWLKAPMTLDVFRAPSSNEVRPAGSWTLAGLHSPENSLVSMSEPVATNGAWVFSTVVRWTCPKAVKLVDFGSSETRLEDAGSPERVLAFDVATVWTVRGDGRLVCQSEIRPDGARMELARVGYRFTLDADNPLVQYYAAGPFENYRDRKSGAFLGRYELAANDFYFPYARNEDCGNREDARAVAFDAGWDHLSFATAGAPFAFGVNPYSPMELVRCNHPPELPEPTKVEFGLFAETRGLGGASCGPAPMARDVIRSNRDYALSFVISPEKRLKGWTVPAAALPKTAKRTADSLARVIGCSSREPGEYEPENVIDGDPDTIWHTQWRATVAHFPHAITVDAGVLAEAKGVRFMQSGSSGGRVKRFTFEVSADGRLWERVLDGELGNAKGWQKVDFARPAKVRYWRFAAISGHNSDNQAASMAEIELVTK